MEKPSRGNLFDDDSEEEFKPTEEPVAKTEEPVAAEVVAAVEEVPLVTPTEEPKAEEEPAAAEVVAEAPIAQADEEVTRVPENDDEEEYVPQAEVTPAAPIVEAPAKPTPAPVVKANEPHVETVAEKKFAEEKEKAEADFKDMEKLDTNQPIAEDKDTDITEDERSKKFTV